MTINRSAAFVDPNAGNGKTINVTAVSLSGADAANYSVPSTAITTANVTQAPLSGTASDLTKTYGQTVVLNGLSGFSSSGLKNGETIGGVTLISAGTSATAGVPGSPYAIVPSAATGGTFTTSNYAITYLNGVLTVNRAPAFITADDKAGVTGTALPPFTASISGLLGLDTPAVVSGLTLTSPATSNSLPGTYSIIPGGATASNYSFTYKNGILSMTSIRREPDAGSLLRDQSVLRDARDPEDIRSLDITIVAGGVNTDE